MRTLIAIALAFFCIEVQAQSVYLWVRNVSTLTNKLVQVDAALGYPNPSTLTYRAINFDMLSNGTNAVVRLDIDLVWSPKYGRYINLVQQIKNQLTDTQWGTDICTNATQLVGKPVARISRDLAKQIGLAYLDQSSPP